MDMSRRTEMLEGVINQLIDEEALGVCFEMHRAIKLGYYELLYPEESVFDKQPIVDVKGLDIFGNAPFAVKKSVDCICPNCLRTLGAQKFAPHLEKCMGMGRNSTRLAAIKKPKAVVDSEHEGSEDNEEDWTYPESRKTAGLKRPRSKDKGSASNSSPHKNGRGPGRPPKQMKDGGRETVNGGSDRERETDNGSAGNGSGSGGGDGRGLGGSFHSLKPSQQMHTVQSFKGLSVEHKVSLLDQICGVVSERTGRLCTRSVNCPQHTEDQRTELRTTLLSSKEKRSLESNLSSPHKRAKLSRRATPDPSDDEMFRTVRSHAHQESSTPRKKNKSSKKNRHGNSSHTSATVLHSSSMYQS